MPTYRVNLQGESIDVKAADEEEALQAALDQVEYEVEQIEDEPEDEEEESDEDEDEDFEDEDDE